MKPSHPTKGTTQHQGWKVHQTYHHPKRRRKKSSKNSISPYNDHKELPASTTAQAVYKDDTPQQDEIGEILSPLVEATKQNSAKEFPAESTEEQDNELGD